MTEEEYKKIVEENMKEIMKDLKSHRNVEGYEVVE
jgi:hypothetical protein